MTSKHRGRPPKSPECSLSESFLIRLDPNEKKAFKDASTLAGAPLSVWIRERLRVSARRELIEAGKPVPFLI